MSRSPTTVNRPSFLVERIGRCSEMLLQIMVPTPRGHRTHKVLSRRLSMVSSAVPSGQLPSTNPALTISPDGSPTKYARNTNSLGTTGQPAVVYIPSGSYTLNSPLQLYVGTVLIGDPLNPPVLKAGYIRPTFPYSGTLCANKYQTKF